MLTKEINALACKYSLPQETIISSIEDAIKEVIFRRIQWVEDIEVIYQDDLYVFNINKEGVKDFPLERLSKKIIKKIYKNIKYKLILAWVKEKYEQIKHLNGSITKGEVFKIYDSFIIIKIDINNLTTKEVYGFYEIKEQPPKERGQYLIGQKLIFYISNIFISKERNIYKLEIKLTRNNKKFGEMVFYYIFNTKNIHNIKIKCHKRIAGYISYYTSSKKIPSEVIKEATRILNERVRVKYV